VLLLLFVAAARTAFKAGIYRPIHNIAILSIMRLVIYDI
jgi:hypothetical protein